MSRLFDTLAVTSVLGIWPRYIEPRLVFVSRLSWKLAPEHAHLASRCFVHLSDLHLNDEMPESFLDKIVRRTLKEKPDAILFTGDFLCHSQLKNPKRLLNFLCRLQAPHGSFCVLGNHDYAQYISCDSKGRFTARCQPHPLKAIGLGLQTLVRPPLKSLSIDPQIQGLPPHSELIQLLAKTPFTVLDNQTFTLPIGLNITGLAELSVGRLRPQTAFCGYQKHLPGIVLLHNPDAIASVKDYPGEYILAGHTHGEQIHLPFWPSLSKKLTRLVDSTYTRGAYTLGQKQIYVTRGLGSPKPFRLFSAPEIVVIRTEK